MRPLSLLSLLAVALTVLPACQTTENAADATADAATTAANATANAATTAADAVADAAGATWSTVTDVFEDDPNATAAVVIRPTSAPGAQAQGTVRFTNRGNDLVARVSLSGLDPGAHGMHIHRNPSCETTMSDGQSKPAGASGGHWDPLSTSDHGAPTSASQNKHKGDLGNITASADGTVETTVTVSGFDPGDYPVAGHALVIHSGRDDLESNPAGNSGTPQGCGVIEGRM